VETFGQPWESLDQLVKCSEFFNFGDSFVNMWLPSLKMIQPTTIFQKFHVANNFPKVIHLIEKLDKLHPQ